MTMNSVPSHRSALRAVVLATAFLVTLPACDRSDAGDTPSALSADTATIAPAPPAPDGIAPPAAAAEVAALDYLTFAQGAVPISIGGAGAGLGANFEHAVRLIDGNPVSFTFANQTGPNTDTEFVYELPAPTTFTRFAVPNVQETPSPSQTFTREVEVYGSTTGPDGGWTLLASATLQTHDEPGQVTELPLVATTPVRWVKVRLVGGIALLSERMFFEFSEIVGNGTQEVPALVDHFQGIWKGRGVLMELKQDGATVTGCYDDGTELNGTVSGNILRASGVDPDDGALGLFVLSVVGEGVLRGVRSSNGGPFRLYTGPPAPGGTTTACSYIPEPQLGCGSIIHGITFDFDSARIRPDSEPVLADLFEGLQAAPDASIVLVGHTSSEGAEAYNQALSERRAQSVVEDLVRRGIDGSRIRAVGKGEAEPIAPNDDESGRSLNRRVEVVCS